jgi:hypothetical protein
MLGFSYILTESLFFPILLPIPGRSLMLVFFGALICVVVALVVLMGWLARLVYASRHGPLRRVSPACGSPALCFGFSHNHHNVQFRFFLRSTLPTRSLTYGSTHTVRHIQLFAKTVHAFSLFNCLLDPCSQEKLNYFRNYSEAPFSHICIG